MSINVEQTLDEITIGGMNAQPLLVYGQANWAKTLGWEALDKSEKEQNFDYLLRRMVAAGKAHVDLVKNDVWNLAPLSNDGFISIQNHDGKDYATLTPKGIQLIARQAVYWTDKKGAPLPPLPPLTREIAALTV